MPVYALTPSSGGPKLPEPTASCAEHDAPPPPLPPPGQAPPVLCGGFMMNAGRLEGRRISMAQFVTALSNFLGRPVIDRTGYTGAFDLHLEFSFDGIAGLSGGGFNAPSLPSDAADSSRPTIFGALQQQLGLRLQSEKGPAEILVIDHASKATPN
jgi:uncharacterized protein (TIGR03435 family)